MVDHGPGIDPSRGRPRLRPLLPRRHGPFARQAAGPGWGCRSSRPSSRRTADGCGTRPRRAAAPRSCVRLGITAGSQHRTRRGVQSRTQPVTISAQPWTRRSPEASREAQHHHHRSSRSRSSCSSGRPGRCLRHPAAVAPPTPRGRSHRPPPGLADPDHRPARHDRQAAKTTRCSRTSLTISSPRAPSPPPRRRRSSTGSRRSARSASRGPPGEAQGAKQAKATSSCGLPRRRRQITQEEFNQLPADSPLRR